MQRRGIHWQGEELRPQLKIALDAERGRAAVGNGELGLPGAVLCGGWSAQCTWQGVINSFRER